MSLPLPPGTRLGRFEILGHLGAGGMGEVYRAFDPQLTRDVAIKILPSALARDPERVARFEREAKVLATFDHPNIGAIYDSGRQDDVLYLIMALVPGETLDDRMNKGALPLRDALVLFRDIAAALEAAHGRGIVHRDLKPQNVKITPDGIVKVLDFGIAKILQREPSGEEPTRTKTGPGDLTNKGDSIGTPPYMSPEQFEGKAVDKRTDIWSFGVCLFEALAGHHPFPGTSYKTLRKSILETEPEFGELPSTVPPAIVTLIERCLRKDVNRRLRDIGDARIEIEEALERPPEPPKPVVNWSRLVWPAIAAAAFALGLVIGWIRSTPPERTELIRRFEILLPPTEPVALISGNALAISPDGSQIAYTVRRGETTELRLRAIDRLEPAPVRGTEGAQGSFFSPTGEEIGFFSGGKLVRMSLRDSAVQPVGESTSARGASWGSERILFSPHTVGGLLSVAVGSPEAPRAIPLADDKGELSQRWPSLLPDGKHALFTSWKGKGSDVEVLNLDTGDRRVVVADGSCPRLTPTGHLVFARDDALYAAPVDESSLELMGAPAVIVEGLQVDSVTGAAFYNFSSEGTLIYAPRNETSSGEPTGLLLGIRRNGVVRLLNPTLRGYQVPRHSPTDSRLLVTLTEADATNVWLVELARGATSRITFEGNNAAAIWHPDGRKVVYSSDRTGTYNLFEQPVDSSAPPRRLTESPNAQFPGSWSGDGTKLAYVELNDVTQMDVWIWNERTGKGEPFLATDSQESGAVFSPDGRYIAYVSNETGEDQVYVRAYPGPGGMWPISIDGGREPAWGGDGAELYYRNKGWMVAVPIATGSDFSAGAPQPLFEAPYDEAGAPYANYSVTKDGQEFVMVRSDDENHADNLVVVLNWFADLERRVPHPR
jgi:serine/threonine-protein kinase